MTKDITIEIHSIKEPPSIREPGGDGWSVDILLISGKKKLRGYYDPQGSVAGGTYFFYENNTVVKCNTLKNFPTHWQYASN